MKSKMFRVCAVLMVAVGSVGAANAFTFGGIDLCEMFRINCPCEEEGDNDALCDPPPQ